MKENLELRLLVAAANMGDMGSCPCCGEPLTERDVQGQIDAPT